MRFRLWKAKVVAFFSSFVVVDKTIFYLVFFSFLSFKTINNTSYEQTRGSFSPSIVERWEQRASPRTGRDKQNDVNKNWFREEERQQRVYKLNNCPFASRYFMITE